ncbi:hypothetical protein [Candidatus Bealeia paramacronuclearis]|uniref:hypothetical protein n=1 Tax=Candidatus Bealeia paramacronuclearis TaxID=1921001 RepID=UPI002F2643E9
MVLFQALPGLERGSKFIYASVYAHAKAQAKRFLLKFVKQSPLIQSIQGLRKI